MILMLNKNLDKMESVFDLVFTSESIKGLILLPYLVSFLLSSYLIVQKLGITKTVKIGTLKPTYMVLIIATVCAIPFIGVFIVNNNPSIDYFKLFISYTVGTSFYELFFKYITPKSK